ncbi:MAG: dipeptidase [candidate division WOR-3 bacterium]
MVKLPDWRYLIEAEKTDNPSVPIYADLHCDSLNVHLRGQRDITRRSTAGHLDIPRLLEAGVNVQVFAIWPDPNSLRPGQYQEFVIRAIDTLKEICSRHSDKLALALSPQELDRIVASGRIAAIIGVEGGHALEGRLDRLTDWWERGVRLLTITWCNSNELGDSSSDETRPNNGLSRLGRDAVREMNRLGMIVDVSHCAETTFWHIINVSSAPVIASHSGVYALCAHHRNLTDEQIRAIARKRGLVGMVFLPGYLRINPAQATIADVVSGISHIIELVGPDSAALGSDFDGFDGRLAGLEDVTMVPKIVLGLQQRRYPLATIAKVMGANFCRVWREVYQGKLDGSL